MTTTKTVTVTALATVASLTIAHLIYRTVTRAKATATGNDYRRHLADTDPLTTDDDGTVTVLPAPAAPPAPRTRRPRSTTVSARAAARTARTASNAKKTA
jgi:hypothetical protein